MFSKKISPKALRLKGFGLTLSNYAVKLTAIENIVFSVPF